MDCLYRLTRFITIFHERSTKRNKKGEPPAYCVPLRVFATQALCLTDIQEDENGYLRENPH